MEGFVALDIETATSSSREICSIAVVRFWGRFPVSQFQAIIRPPCGCIEPRLIQIHGISNGEITACPELREVWPHVEPFFADSPVVVAHNVSFDVPALLSNLEGCGIQPPAFSIVCSLELCRSLLPDLPSHRLPDVASELGVPLSQHHDALADARAAGAVVLVLAKRLGCVRPSDLFHRSNVLPQVVQAGEAFSTSFAAAAVSDTEMAFAEEASGRVREAISGRKFVFTGDLAYMERGEAEALVQSHGGRVMSAVSKKTHYLVVGKLAANTVQPGKSSKLLKAEAAARDGSSIQILDEDAFLQLVSGGNNA